jgi:protein involved in polysaccharide export with SLBB domain
VGSARQGDGSPADFDQTQKPAVPVVQVDRVQPGYLWEISSVEDKGINGKFRVDFDGKLRLAYGIVIDTNSGANSAPNSFSVEAMRQKIIDSFRPFLKSVDQIRVQLLQRKIWIDVRGLVNKPGKFLVSRDESLDSILAEAGGVTPNSQAEYVQIQQSGGARAISLSDYYDTGNSSLLPAFEGGAVFFVQRKNEVSAALAESSHPVIQILGEVKNPGEISYRPNGDFLYYLTRAGGPSSVADLERIELIRYVNGRRKSQVYDWEDAHQLANLRPEDLIIVHSDRPSRFERVVQIGAGFAAILSAIGILVIAF